MINDINTLADYLGPRDLPALTPAALEGKYGIPQADAFVLFGGSILPGGDVFAAAKKAEIAKKYIIVGGHGHTTDGLLMAVPLGKLTGDEKGQEEAAVLNLKLAEEKLPALLKKADFFPAYHMNKQNWLSVLLNNDLPDEEVLAMLDESRAFTDAFTEIK